MMQVIKSSEDHFVWNLTCSNTIKESNLESTCTPKHHVRTLAPGRGEEPQTTAAEAVGVKTEKGKGKKKKQMAGRGPSEERSRDRGGVPWNFLLALPFCRSSWCHYSRRLREFRGPG